MMERPQSPDRLCDGRMNLRPPPFGTYPDDETRAFRTRIPKLSLTFSPRKVTQEMHPLPQPHPPIGFDINGYASARPYLRHKHHPARLNILDKTFDLWDKERFGRRLRKRETPAHIDGIVTQRDVFQHRKPFEVHASNLDELTWRRRGKEPPIIAEEKRTVSDRPRRPSTVMTSREAHPPSLEDASHGRHFQRRSNHAHGSGLETTESKKPKDDSVSKTTGMESKTARPPSPSPPPTASDALHRPMSAVSSRPGGMMVPTKKDEDASSPPHIFQSRMRRKDASIAPARPRSATADIRRRRPTRHFDVTGKVTEIHHKRPDSRTEHGRNSSFTKRRGHSLRQDENADEILSAEFLIRTEFKDPMYSSLSPDLIFNPKPLPHVRGLWGTEEFSRPSSRSRTPHTPRTPTPGRSTPRIPVPSLVRLIAQEHPASPTHGGDSARDSSSPRKRRSPSKPLLAKPPRIPVRTGGMQRIDGKSCAPMSRSQWHSKRIPHQSSVALTSF
eukprot:TRINITY_DN2716_c0_g1_i1.p1 TRINITY_DN2716_c0_g1~~TRINITY_DN2716_c0_g1_i1.p1  ORF type:complete len:501 (+),score=105.86 TRINITY_DN2716_c0_g1_i1:2349-3851(+)